MTITQELYEKLEAAKIVKIGKPEGFGGYVINTKQRKKRTAKKRLSPNFNILGKSSFATTVHTNSAGHKVFRASKSKERNGG
jgi:hypothetical protein